MSLAVSARLGPYEIAGPLGAGAMGEVYRARDTRLGRDVALKVIAEEVARDASRLQRFEREARAVAALNHPNIVSLFDVGSADGTEYMVTELVDGESLRALLDRGRLPLRKVLDLAVQIAEGLAAAHAAGITHRDLKPANVMVTREGRVKILDFGLARQSTKRAEPAADVTITTHETEPGMIVGTVGYMSPEQIHGSELDHRSDQFSFGLLLYEMLTGERAFERPDRIQTMNAILTEDAPAITQPIPAPLQWTLDRCLQKDVHRRYAATLDLAHDLADLRDHLSQSQTASAITPALPAALAPQARFWKRAALAAAGVLLLAVATAAILLVRADRPTLGNYRYTPFAIESAGQCCASWSPDGKAVAYIGSPDHHARLYLRYLGSPAPILLPEVPNLRPESLVGWSSDSRKILTVDYDKHCVWSVPAVGGEPEQVELPDTEGAIAAAALAPDGRTLAFFMKKPGATEGFTIWSTSLGGRELHRYSPDPFAVPGFLNGCALAFSPDGRKLLLMLTGLDAKNRNWLLPWPHGTPKQILPQLSVVSLSSVHVAWMPDSRNLMLALAAGYSAHHLFAADTESGRMNQITTGNVSQIKPALSPDGQKVMYEERTADYDIISVALADGKVSRLVATAAPERMAAWSRGTNRLAYVTDRNGTPEIWVREGDGTNRPVITARELPAGEIGVLMNPAISPDGQRIIYAYLVLGRPLVLWVASLQGGAAVRLTNTSASNEFGGAWSPDGKWFAYGGESGGKGSLMKVKTTGESTPILLHDVKYCLPDWSPANDWISYYDDGWLLTTPDGKTTRKLGDLQTQYVAFSADGKQLWFVRTASDKVQLVTLDLATNKERVVADLDEAYSPASDSGPGIRFTLAPDGKSLAYSFRKESRTLWMLEGFLQRPPRFVLAFR